jgi:hypothetical protein
MKTLLTLLVAAAFVMPVMAADEAPKTKQVCIDAVGKDGKVIIDPKTKQPRQICKTMKIHKKHEGTEFPVKK